MGMLDRIRSAALAYLAGDVDCVPVSNDQSRVACSMPLEYPDGDHVVAWVTPQNGGAVVTDYGKGFERVLAQPPSVRATLKQLGRGFADGQGVDFHDERLSVHVDMSDVGEAIWRVAAASAQLAQAGVVFQPRRRGRDNEFEREVAGDLGARRISFETRAPIEGASGRVHHATFYIPFRHAAIEPVSASGPWSQVASVYGKFGDFAHANGASPSRFSLLDDRSDSPSPKDVEFLRQVSDVIPWSERDRLIEQVT